MIFDIGWHLMVGSWGRSEVGSAPSSDLVRSWSKTCGWKMGQPGLKTGAPSSDQGLVRRWGRPVLRPGRSEDGAQHLHITQLLSSPPLTHLSDTFDSYLNCFMLSSASQIALPKTDFQSQNFTIFIIFQLSPYLFTSTFFVSIMKNVLPHHGSKFFYLHGKFLKIYTYKFTFFNKFQP